MMNGEETGISYQCELLRIGRIVYYCSFEAAPGKVFRGLEPDGSEIGPLGGAGDGEQGPSALKNPLSYLMWVSPG